MSKGGDQTPDPATTVIDVAAFVPVAERPRLRAAEQPAWVEPMLATLTDRRFSDPAWIFERKLDGIRCLAFRRGADVRLLSRKRQRLENTYPEVADALGAQAVDDFVVDGEMVAFEGDRTSFSLLQQRSGITDPARARRSPVAVVYYVFDLLHVAGYDTRALPLRTRKVLLRKTLRFTGPLRFTTHRNGEGAALFQAACARGWEGLIAKRADAPYLSSRSPNWLKLKCSQAQEFVVGGFTDPAGSRQGFGALLVGYYEGSELRYAGKVGTGFDDRTLESLHRHLRALEVDKPPFAGVRRWERGTHFVRPALVAQVAFTEWTRDGMLRQPRFEGIRTDKDPAEVSRERPIPGR